MIAPRLQQLYQWSAHELAAPGLLDCISDGALTYAWAAEDRDVWPPPKSFMVQLAQRALPPGAHRVACGWTHGRTTGRLDSPLDDWAAELAAG